MRLQVLEKLAATPHRTPWLEKITADSLLRWFYMLPTSPVIEIEGMENLPQEEPVFLCLEKPDPALFIPFMLGMYKHRSTRYPAYWAPHHFFRRIPFRVVLPATNMISVPSRGETVQEPFCRMHGRNPTPIETDTMLALCEGIHGGLSPACEDFIHGFGADEAAFIGWLDDQFTSRLSSFFEVQHLALYENNLNIICFLRDTGTPGERGIDRTLPIQSAMLHKRPLLKVTSRRIPKSSFSDRDHLLYTIAAPQKAPLLNSSSGYDGYKGWTHASMLEHREVLMGSLKRLCEE